MSFLKPLCRVCSCPAVDGAVQAIQVDKEKLKLWRPDCFVGEIEDTDLICYFCIWNAEKIHTNKPIDDSKIWWPRDLSLDGAAKELRRNFIYGDVKQCRVELKKFKAKPEPKWHQCIYCEKSYRTNDELQVHCKVEHPTQPRFVVCPERGCHAYFDTSEERDEHFKHVHNGGKDVWCRKLFIEKQESGSEAQTYKVCTIDSCEAIFESGASLRQHVASEHMKNKLVCVFCLVEYKSGQALKCHVESEHNMNMYFKCDKCSECFTSQQLLTNHESLAHINLVCKFCNSEVLPKDVGAHFLSLHDCHLCGEKFNCSFRFEAHSYSCQNPSWMNN
ncbi:telomere zinc finger-associated protein-like [Cloeon dipterum]|uniref:telomere zinc finger-associated protein-like n=1 Tax=Cloeon dipterum TaxID=197152 RepID=UPI003220911D